MKLSTPRWWYVRERDRSSMPLTRALLTPISWIWISDRPESAFWKFVSKRLPMSMTSSSAMPMVTATFRR